MGLFKNFLFGIMAIIAPTVLYELTLTLLKSIGIDAPTFKILLAVCYALFAFLLVIIVYENTTANKNKLIIVLLDILGGSLLFFFTYPSWVPIFYMILSLFSLMYWRSRFRN